MADGFADPYLWPGETVLRNKLGLHSHEELAEAEYELTLQRRMQLEDSPIKGNFDLNHLLAVHGYLFQDIYDWAGQVRTVVIHKGNSTFHTPNRIDMAAQYTFGKLHAGHLLTTTVTDEQFLDEITDLLDDINYIHPAREGNGRTQRAFLDQIAKISGRTLTWRNVNADEGNRAAAQAVAEGKQGPLRAFMAKVVKPPRDGAPGFGLETYRVDAAPASTAATDAECRCRRCGSPLKADESIARGYGPSCWNKRYE